MLELEFIENASWKHHLGKTHGEDQYKMELRKFLGVRSKSGELIVADCESKGVEHVRIVKRILQEQ